MLKIGLTGGIGSGKSTVSRIFNGLGILCFEADSVSKQLLQTTCYTPILQLLGHDILDKTTNKIDTHKMAIRIFSNGDLLQKVNKILHPAVQYAYNQWLNEYSYLPYTLKEAAILFESGSYLQLDKIITISAIESVRIERVIRRNTTTLQEIQKRIANQWTEDQRIQAADYVIYNNEKDQLIQQVYQLHTHFLTVYA